MSNDSNSKQHRSQSKERHEVSFYTYPKFLFCWPLIAVGFILCFFGGWGAEQTTTADQDTSVVLNDSRAPASQDAQAAATESSQSPASENARSSETLAWIWIITLIVVLITVGFDLSRNFTIFWLVLGELKVYDRTGFWFMIVWLQDVKSVKIFSWIYHLIADRDPQYSAPMGLVVSIFLSILFLIMWIWTRINSKWRITHNEFEHYQFGRMDDSLARGAKRVRTSYPDFFEFLLCLAGDLIIYDSTGRRQLRRIPHVPWLPIVRQRINRILETTAITADLIDDEQEAEVMETAEGIETTDDSDRNV